MPQKPIDMHRHLGGSIPLDTLHRLLQIPIKDIIRDHVISTPISYARFFRKFDILEQIKWSADIIYNCILDMSAEARKDETRGILLSISLDKYLNSGMAAADIIDALTQAKRDSYLPIDYLWSFKYESQIEHILSRCEYPTNNNKYKDVFSGLDFIGNENELYKNDISSLAKEWLEAKKIVRAHVGECNEEANVSYAVRKLKANRIAHGICIKSQSLIDYVVENAIPFDLCISSNYLTSNIRTITDHPLRRMFRSGLRITLGTDDPTVFNTTMANELKYCKIILDHEYNDFYENITNEAY